MSYQSIGAALKAVLDAVKAAPWSVLADAFAYDVPDADTGYPYAVVSAKDSSEEESDTFTNSARYSFVLRVVDVDADKAAMETRMRGLADAVLAELRKKENATLGGTAERLAPFAVTWGWDQSANVPTRVFQISVDAWVRWTVS